MKITSILMVVLGILFTMSIEAQSLKTPVASPQQYLKQDFALSSIEITYSRPAMRGRKIFGDLVPYGKLWRTGANAATKLYRVIDNCYSILGIEIFDHKAISGSDDPFHRPDACAGSGLIAVGGGGIATSDSHTQLCPRPTWKQKKKKKQSGFIHEPKLAEFVSVPFISYSAQKCPLEGPLRQ
jgi:hypothetical protein